MDKRFTYLVEKYLDNSLSEKQKAVFEKYLEDPACREYLEDAEKIEKIINTGLKKILSLKTKEDLDFEMAEAEIPEEIKQDVLKYGSINDPEARATVRRMHERMIRRNRIRFLLKYVLPAVFLIISLITLWTGYIKPTPQSLYRAWYKPYEFTVVSTSTVPDERIRSAMTMYKSADYAGSARLCNEIIASGSHKGNIHFLYGLNLMALDSMQSAIREFDTQIDRLSVKDTDKHLPVYRYKGLCYLKLGRPDSALLTIMKGYYREFRRE
jgi:hypothetical protein